MIVRNAKIWLAGHDLSGDANGIGSKVAAELPDGTRFGDAARRFEGGLAVVTTEARGFVNPALDANDQVIHSKVGASGEVLSYAESGVEGVRAWSHLCTAGEYSHGGKVGELYTFTLSAQGAGSILIPGSLLANKTGISATASGTAFQVGAVSASQKLYAALHVLSAPTVGPSLTMKVQSDNAVGFPSSTDRITFTAATAIGAQFATPVPGAITDDWWRASWTAAGTSGTWSFVLIVGIL